MDFILTRKLSSGKEDRVLLKFLVDQSQLLKDWRNVSMKCIQIYLLFLRMIVLEQLPRGNVNIAIAATVVCTQIPFINPLVDMSH